MKIRHVLIILCIAIIGIIGFLFGKNFFFNGNYEQNSELPEVTVSILKPVNTSITKQYPGRTAAYQLAEIRPQVSGIISNRMFTQGEHVQQGQQLYQIDPAIYQSTYKVKLANLQKIEANKRAIFAKKKRYDNLLKSSIISKQEHDDITSQLEQADAEIQMAEAEIDKAKIELDYTKVYAPISGIIGKSSVTKGALVTANQREKLATITQLDPIYVDVQLSNNQFVKLKKELGTIKDTPISLILDNEEKYEQQGKLLFHEFHVNKSTNSIELRAVFPNHDHFLFPGSFVRIIVTKQYPQALLIPQNITWRDAQGSLFVWVVNEENTAIPTEINSDDMVGDSWLVSGGIEAGAKIITSNYMNLTPNTKVKIIPEESAPSSHSNTTDD